jgi:phage terminase small subunit
MVAKRGVLQRDSDRRGGPERVAPWAKLAASEQRLVLDLSRALGLTPLSRSAVRVPPPQHTEPPSELEQILNEPAIDYSRPS